MSPLLRTSVLAVLLWPALLTAQPAPPDRADGWTTATPAEAGLAEAPLAALHDSLQAGAFGAISSVLLARGGRLAYEVYLRGTASTLRNTRSATKTITGALVGTAIHQNLMPGPEAPVMPHLKARPVLHPDPRKDQISFQDLLTMSSVMECDDWNTYSRGNEERMYIVEDWLQFFLDLPIKAAPPWETPPAARPYGRAFNYCTAGVYTLGRALSGLTGQPVEAYAQTHLFDPLGIEKMQWPRSPKGHAQTGGGLELQSRDLLKLAQLYANGGTWHGVQVLPASWVAASMQPYAQFYGTDGTPIAYGYLWWIRPFDQIPVYYMAGSGGNMVAVVPSLDLTVVITSENFRRRDAHALTERLLSTFILPSAKP